MKPSSTLALAVTFLLTGEAVAAGGGLPEFASDQTRDEWLRTNSPFYRSMAESIDRNGGYQFRRGTKHPMGLVTYDHGQRFIELHDSLTGPKRLSILVFEITNAFQQSKHDEIDAAARNGSLTSAREFGVRHELIELDGLRLHRRVLIELEAAIATPLPAEMLSWIGPDVTTLATYEVPFAHDFIKAQETGGHTAHYWKWFARQAPPRTAGVPPATSTRRQDADRPMAKPPAGSATPETENDSPPPTEEVK